MTTAQAEYHGIYLILMGAVLLMVATMVAGAIAEARRKRAAAADFNAHVDDALEVAGGDQ